MSYLKTSACRILLTLLIGTVPAAASLPAGAAAPGGRSGPDGSLAYGHVPMSFEENRGQAAPEVKFVAHGSGYSLALTDREAVLAMSAAAECKASAKACAVKQGVIRMRLAGAQTTRASAEAELSGKVNYFLGANPALWRTDVPTYARVRYAQAYPGIDLVYYGTGRQLEYDFVLAPGANAARIRLQLTGDVRLALGADGDLLLQGPAGEAVFHKPVVYQERDGRREAVEGSFRLLADKAVGFAVGSYDHSRALVIDPVLVYATYLGGAGGSSSGDVANGVAVDGSGSAYLVGTTPSSDFPVTSGAFQTTNNVNTAEGATTAFVSKFNAAGTALVYSTFLGGSSTDTGVRIALDAVNNAYVTGVTYSQDFPVTCGAFQTTNPGAEQGTSAGFVTKLNAQGNALVYSTYLGGSGNHTFPAVGDAPQGLAVDTAGNAYVTGFTGSRDFPVTEGAFQTQYAGGATNPNAFVTKLNASGTALVYSTYLGGAGSSTNTDPYAGSGDYGNDIVVDAVGHALVAGATASANFPVTGGAAQSALAGQMNAFVTELNIAGNAEIFSTYLGGSITESASAIALGSDGSVYVAGNTGSSDFPTTAGVLQTKTQFPGSPTGFVTRLNAEGSAFTYSTYLEGQNTTVAGLAVDSSGAAYVTGSAATYFAGNFGGFVATPDALPTPHTGGNSAFVVKLDAAGAHLNYATLLGGTYNDAALNLALDQSGNAYVVGYANSVDFPVTAGAFQPQIKGNHQSNAFLAKFALAGEANQTTYPTGAPLLIPTTMTVSGGISDVNCNDEYGETYSVCFGFGMNADAPGPAPTGVIDFDATGGGFEFPGPFNPYPQNNAQFLCYNELEQDPPGTIELDLSATYSGDANYLGSSASATYFDNTCPAGPYNDAQGKKPAVRKRIQIQMGVRSQQDASFLNLPSSGLHVRGPRYAVPPASAVERLAARAGSAVRSEASPQSSACHTVPVATPVFAPGAGAYAAAQSVTITDSVPGATIYYALHGTVPTTGSTRYTGPIAVSATQTIKAIAVAPGFTQSAVASATYTIQLPTAAPIFKPAAGAYPAGLTVALSDATPGAAIYYALHGVTPTTASSRYTGPIAVTTATTIKAIAVAPGYAPSAVASAAYSIQAPAATPVFKPAAGAYPAGLTVTLSDATPGAAIYYAVHGVTPTTASTRYTGPIPISAATTIKAIAVAPGYSQSAVASALYTIEAPAAAPVFKPATGTYAPGQTVTITDAAPGAVIYYAVHGATPTTASTKYTGPITVSATETIKAIAVAPGYSQSAVTSATYTIR